MKSLFQFFALFLFLAFASSLHSDPSPTPEVKATPPAPNAFPFQDTKLSFEARVDDLTKRMTSDEKCAQLMMDAPAIPRLGVHAYYYWNEALHGMARNGTATVFPQAIALAATWDPVLHHKIADTISTEIRAKNNDRLLKTGGDTGEYQGLTIWSPNINIFRDPRWGRGQETYGEDPFLTGTMGVAFVTGLQGDDPTYLKTVATLKHFAVHSGPESLRHVFDAHPTTRDLYETYLPAFEMGVRQGHAWSLMSAYNAVDGVPAPANTFLLTDTLRNTWGFKGAVVGDVDTVGDAFRSHHYGASVEETCADCLKAGNDECSGCTYKALPDALKKGLITESDLDRAVKRLFLLRFKLGQFDPPEKVPYRQIPLSELGSDQHDALALTASEESLVLLKNKDNALPWNPKDLKTVAILGPTADNNEALIGNYSGTPAHPVTILKGLKTKLEALGVKVLYDPAVPLVFGLKDPGEPLPKGVLFIDDKNQTAGLSGQFYKDDSFKTPTKDPVRTDENLGFSWDPAQPVNGIPTKAVNIRWSGVLVPKETGTYSLGVTYIGGVVLNFNGTKLIDEKHAKDLTKVYVSSNSVSLTAGQVYPIQISYSQPPTGENGQIKFGWHLAGNNSKPLELAKQADHIILTLGLSSAVEGEQMSIKLPGFAGGDRDTIALPAVQEKLISEVAALGKPFIIVLTNGSAVSFDTEAPAAILDAWYYGQRGGDAVAATILGEYNPGGRLPITFYKSDADLPVFTDYSMANRTYRYFKGTPLFAFGYGLSYTTFSEDQLALSSTQAKRGDTVSLSVAVKNTGSRSGDEVVEVYARAVKPLVPMPQQWLVGFQRVNLAAGETKTVTIPLSTESLHHYDEAKKSYVVDPGSYEFDVGPSSDHLPLTTSLEIQ